MAIDLHKEHYGSDGDKKFLTVYPENDVPEIYPQREVYPQPKTANADEIEKLPAAKTEGDAEVLPKTGDKKKNIIAAVLLTAAAAIIISAAFAFISVGTERNKINQQEQLFPQNDVSGVSINAENANVTLRYSYSSGNISVESVTDNNTHCTASNNNGILNISFENTAYGKYDNTGTLTVTFPARFYGEVDVTGKGNSSVSSEAGGNLHIETENGDINVSNLKADAVQLIAVSGNISVNNSVIDTLDIRTDSGDIYIADSEAGLVLTARAYDGDFTAKGMVSSGETEIKAYSRNYMDGNVSCENITLGENADIFGSQGLMLVNAEFHNISIGSRGYIDIYPTLPKELYWIKKSGSGTLYLGDECFRTNTVNYNPAGDYIIDISSGNTVMISWSLNEDPDQQTQP